MGNSQSQAARGLHAPQLHGHGGVRPGIPGGPAARWPRAEPPILVLPQVPPPIALRNTPNGAILQQGGTISSRPQNIPHGARRARSSSAHRPPNPESPDLARCGSEPDLRAQMNQQRDPRDPRHHHMTRGRKKYRAPPAPHPGVEFQSGMESSSPDLNGWDGAPRKARLFKTRAETSRRPQEEDTNRRLAQTLSLPRPDMREDKAWPEQTESRTWQNRTELREEAKQRRPDSREELKQRRPESREEVKQRRPESREELKQRRPESREEMRRLSRPESREDHKRPGRRYAGDGETGSGGKAEARDQIVWTRREDGLSLPRMESREARRSGFQDETALHRSRSQDALSAKSLSSPEFQAELVEAANKIRPRSALIPRHINNRSSPSPEVPIQQVLRGQHGQEFTKENTQPAKTFYFGMEESNKTVVKDVNSNVNKTNREHRLTAVERSKNIMNKRHKSMDPDVDETVLEHFAANFQKNRQQHSVSGTSSLGSDPDPDEVDGGIALQLRPTLPKKQLEIPRFSPTAAWRLLSSVDVSPAASPDSGRGILEDRIPAPDCVQLSLDKSADSGISGDASPGGGHESSSELIDSPPKTIHYSHHHQAQKSLLLAWTPEQDLEESSSEEEPPLHSKLAAAPGAKLTTRGQLFSTLPRERVDDAAPEAGAHFNSLRRPTIVPSHPSDSNWLLSRSVPGSLNNGHATLLRTSSSPTTPEEFVDEPPSMTKFPSYSYLAQGGHVVYLPEYKSRCSPENRGMSLNCHELNAPTSHFHQDVGMGNSNLSRSCENVCADMQETDEPWSLRSNNRCFTEQRPHKKKKFTFQSTVRLIENKRLAEKLSKEAEFKENQRLGELDAMRRVEEEFQRKRAREKANIRHQLRLFSLEEKEYTSLPPLDWGRPEPDGAPMSLPPQPRVGAATQVLSEFRETTRDYRDYTHSSSRHSPDIVEAPPRKNVVKHPRIVADIPKNLPVYVSAQPSNVIPSPRPRDNYRKEFAHGSLQAGRTNSSDSDSQPRTRPGSRQTGSRTRCSPQSDSRSRSASPLAARTSSESPTLRASRSKSSSSRESTSRSPTPQRQQSESPEPLVQPWTARKRSLNQPSPSTSPSSFDRSRSVSKSPKQGRRSRSNSPRRNKKISSASDEPRSRSVTPIADKSQQQAPLPQQRALLSTVQPFNKAGKSYRPINFTPRKIAQTVT